MHTRHGAFSEMESKYEEANHGSHPQTKKVWKMNCVKHVDPNQSSNKVVESRDD